jgi:hypothetical protein
MDAIMYKITLTDAITHQPITIYFSGGVMVHAGAAYTTIADTISVHYSKDREWRVTESYDEVISAIDKAIAKISKK